MQFFLPIDHTENSSVVPAISAVSLVFVILIIITTAIIIWIKRKQLGMMLVVLPFVPQFFYACMPEYKHKFMLKKGMNNSNTVGNAMLQISMVGLIIT